MGHTSSGETFHFKTRTSGLVSILVVADENCIHRDDATVPTRFAVVVMAPPMLGTPAVDPATDYHSREDSEW